MPKPGSTTARGYGYTTHVKQRQALTPQVNAGNAYCTEPICLQPTRHITPGTPWDLAHDRTTGQHRGPAHRRCNRAEGAHHRNTRQRQRAWHAF